MKFDALPQTSLVDETLVIRVIDLRADERITLAMWSTINHLVLNSSATFIADSEGVVDLSSHAPVSGSYQGVDSMGLFWSRAPVNADIAKRYEGASKNPFTVTLTAEGERSTSRISHSFEHVFAGPGVASRELRDGGLVGKMFEPDRPGPHKAILVVGGSTGGLVWSQEMAALLASRGYAALALAYFAAEGLPATLDRIPLEYFRKALDWLSAQTTVAARSIAVVGQSRGGELALLLGATFSDIRAVVAYVPSGILGPAFPENGHGAWTLSGRELPYAKTLTVDEWNEALASGRARPDSFDWFLIPLKDAAYVEEVSIPVEKINGPVLLITGIDDKVWPSTELTEFAVERFKRHGFRNRVEHLAYAGAGHSIIWPNAPTTMLKSKHSVSGEEIDRGGTPEGTARARQESWPRMLAFLRDVLAEG